MVARTKRGFDNVSRPRPGSGIVARTRRRYAKVARLRCGFGMALDPQLLGLVWSTNAFSFFSFSWQLKCTIIICLFVVYLGLTIMSSLRALSLAIMFGVKPRRGFNMAPGPWLLSLAWPLDLNLLGAWVLHDCQI